MPILDNPVTNIAPSADVVASRLKQQAFQQFQQLVSVYEQGLRNFWKNPHCSPQEIADALGVEAYELFQLHGAIKATILAVKPDATLTEVSAYGEYTANEDGSITIDSVV
jgi:hypothetical protein